MRDYGAGNWPCQPLSHKPPGCQKRVLWPWQVLGMADKGHEPSPSPHLGGREKPGQTQQIKVIFSLTKSQVEYFWAVWISWKWYSILLNITIVYSSELIPSQSRWSFLPELFFGPPGIPRPLSCLHWYWQKNNLNLLAGPSLPAKQNTINALWQCWKWLYD